MPYANKYDSLPLQTNEHIHTYEFKDMKQMLRNQYAMKSICHIDMR